MDGHPYSDSQPTDSRSSRPNKDIGMADHKEHSDRPLPGQTVMEQEIPLAQAFKTFPTAVFWFVCLSATLTMESYDTAVVTNLTSVAPFNKKYGHPIGNGEYQLDASYQSLLAVAPAMGEVLGLLFNGWASDRFGHKKVIFASIVCLTGFLLIPFYAQTLGVLFADFFLVGLPLGVLQTACVAYASEACPVGLRAQLTTYTNLCWVVGQLIGTGVWRSFSARIDEWSYKATMAIQWVWPIPLGIAVLLAPESPWWLIGKGRREECWTSLRRLANPCYVSDADLDAYMVSMEETLARENLTAESIKSKSYLDCFRGTDLRRTEIVVITGINQITSGAALMGYDSYFFQTIGLSTSTAFTMSIILNVIGLFGTISAWPIMEKVGRRDMYLYGSLAMAACLTWMGIASVTGTSSTTPSGYSSAGCWAMVASLLVWTSFYQSTVGPVCYAIVSEIPSAALRSKTMVLGCAGYNSVGIPIFFLMTRMMNPGAWNRGRQDRVFWGGITAIVSVWVLFRLPEPKGRLYAELNFLFGQNTPARKFKMTVMTAQELYNNIDGLSIEDQGGASMIKLSRRTSTPVASRRNS